MRVEKNKQALSSKTNRQERFFHDQNPINPYMLFTEMTHLFSSEDIVLIYVQYLSRSLTNEENDMSERIIRRAEVEHLTGLSCTTIYDRMAKNQFPKNFSLGGKIVEWTLSSIENWIDERCGNSNEQLTSESKIGGL
jgi:prophage regulatory protein